MIIESICCAVQSDLVPRTVIPSVAGASCKYGQDEPCLVKLVNVLLRKGELESL